MKRLHASLGLGVMLLALAGCAHLGGDERCTDFGDVEYCLQSTQGVVPFATMRSVVMVRGQESSQLIMNLEIDEASGMRMAGLTPFGRRVLWIQLDRERRLSVESDIPVDATQILTGVQFADWPIDRVRAGLRGERARVVETKTDTGTMRQLKDGERVVLSATCEGERPLCRRALLRYETFGYALEIETLDHIHKP